MKDEFEKCVEIEEAPNYFISNWGRCKKRTKHKGFHFIQPFLNNKKATTYVIRIFVDKK